MPFPVLVTGGAGYIGSHVCKALKKRGFFPVVVDNFSTAKKKRLPFPMIEGDISSKDVLEKIFSLYKPKAVLHFAGSSQVQESLLNPLLYYENNVGASLALFKSCLEFKVEYLLFSSSCSVYGIPSSLPLKETSLINPITPYGYTKSVIEKILFDFDRSYNLKSVILRYFNAAGADIEKELGEEHEPETHLIPLAIRAALFPEKPLSIFGNDFPTEDGYAIRDFIHVTDLAEAHVLALVHLLQEKKSDIFNVGSGKGVSVKKVCDMVEQVTKKPLFFQILPKKEGDPPCLFADTKKIEEKLSFKPLYSDLKEIVETAFFWENSLLKKREDAFF